MIGVNIFQGNINIGGTCETTLTVYSPYPGRFESLTFGGVITGQHFLLSYFKTLSDGPAGVELTTSHMVTEPPVAYLSFESSSR